MKPYLRALTTASYLGLAALTLACGGSLGSPTAPNSTSNAAILQVYNTSTSQRKDMTVETQGNSQVTLNAVNLAGGLDGVVTSEFTVRRVEVDGSLGSRVVAAGSEASVSPGRYEVFIPSVDGQSIYGCIPNPQLLNSKRNFIVGVKHNPGVDASNVPMYVFRDAVNEIDRNMVTGNGRRYGSIKLIEHAINPDLTVGFSNEESPRGSTFAWWEGNSAYMLSPQSNSPQTPTNYRKPIIMDGAVEEVMEVLARKDNFCGIATRKTIGKSAVSGSTEWGMNSAGRALLLRNLTRAR